MDTLEIERRSKMTLPRIPRVTPYVEPPRPERTFPDWELNWVRLSKRKDGTGYNLEVETNAYNFDTETTGKKTRVFRLGNVFDHIGDPVIDAAMSSATAAVAQLLLSEE